MKINYIGMLGLLLLLAAAMSACSNSSTTPTTSSSSSTADKSVVYAVKSSVSTTICANSGVEVDAGIDTNGNGVLDPSEVTSMQYICNGTNGTDGANGSNGYTALVANVAEPAGSNCANGGEKVNVGLDTNGNNVLDSTEITSSDYICNGANGINGTAGVSGLNVLMDIVSEFSGTICANGGMKVASGLDANGNNALDSSEVTNTSYVCNGTNGLNTLVSIVTESSGTNCAYGGQKITSGLDTNNSGVLDPSEVTSTEYVCNGAPGSTVSMMPVIQSISAAGLPANESGTVTVTANAQSAQGLSLNYQWSVSNGWVLSTGATTSVVTITAPNSYNASGMATVIITDTQSKTAVGTIALSTVGDSAPVIESISIYPQPVFTSANLVASAYDANNDSLTYSWTIGGIAGITGSSAVWSSPGIPGYYTVGLAVSDGTTTVSGSSSVSVDSASPWPKFRRNIQGTGMSFVDTSNDTGLVTLWTYTTGGAVTYSAPAISADGTVYFGSSDNLFYAINPDGTLKWSYSLGFPPYSSSAIGADGTVYVGSTDSKLYAFNPNGTLKWSYKTGSYVRSSPAIGADGTIYVGSDDSKLYAINANGTLKWSYLTTIGEWVDSSPAIGTDGTIYVGCDDHYLYAINPDGTRKWRFATGLWIKSSPAIGADGTVYVGSEDSKLYAINSDGTLKWSYTTLGAISSSPAIGADGTVYIASQDGKLYAINSNSTTKWSYTTGGVVSSSPAIGADGTVYVGAYGSMFYAINPNGTLKWSYPIANTEYSSPAIGVDGTIYVGSDDGKLYAIK